MARKNEQTALAVAPPVEDTELALANAFDFDFGEDDGLQEVDGEDFRLPVLVMNMKGTRQDGELHRLDEFYDTLNEKSYKSIRCAFIHLHKTNAFVQFDEAKNENVYVCSSGDRDVGRLRVVHPSLGLPEGTERRCETCPDQEWRKNEKGKNVRNCSTHYGVFSTMLDDDLRPVQDFLIRFKRTSLQPFKTHLQKHHLGRRPLPNGGRGNWPLYAFEVRMRLQVDKGGNFATPVIERGAPLPKETVQRLFEQAKMFREIGDVATRAAEKQEAQHERTDAPAGGDNYRADDFSD